MNKRFLKTNVIIPLVQRSFIKLPYKSNQLISICNAIIILNTLRNDLTYSIFRRKIGVLNKKIFMNSASQIIHKVFFFQSIMDQHF